MANTKIEELARFGQSIWLDYISRSMIRTGKIQKMIDQIEEQTSIFQKLHAISPKAFEQTQLAEMMSYLQEAENVIMQSKLP